MKERGKPSANHAHGFSAARGYIYHLGLDRQARCGSCGVSVVTVVDPNAFFLSTEGLEDTEARGCQWLASVVSFSFTNEALNLADHVKRQRQQPELAFPP